MATADEQRIDERIRASVAARAICHRMGDDDGVELLTLEIDLLLEERAHPPKAQAY